MFVGQNTSVQEDSKKILDSTNTLISIGKLSEAIKLNKQISRNYSKNNLKPDSLVVKSYNNLSQLFSETQQLDSAQVYSDKALAYFKQKNITKHEDYATTIYGLSTLYRKKLDLEKALKYGNQYLDMVLENHGENHKNSGNAYNNIGMIHYTKGDIPKTIVFFKKAADVRIISLGKNHPDVAQSYNNLGTLSQINGDLKQALFFYTKTKNILSLEKNANKDNSALAQIYTNIGAIHHFKKDINLAIEYYIKSIDSHGDNNPAIGTAYTNLAIAYKDLGEHKKALATLDKSLVLRRKFYGEKHIALASIYHTFGEIYSLLSQYEKAIENHLKALQLRENTPVKSNKDIANSYFGLAQTYEAKQDYNHAEKYYLKALEKLKEYENTKNPFIAHVCLGLSDINLHFKKYSLVEKNLKKVINSLHYSYDDPQNFTALNNPNNLIGYFQTKIKYYKALLQKTSNIKYQDSLDINYNNAINLQKHIQQSLFREGSKDFINKETYVVYEGAMDHYNRIQTNHKSFILSEKIRARQLLQNFNKSEINNIASDSILKYDTRLFKQITDLEKKKFIEIHENNKNDSVITNYNDQLFKLNELKDKNLIQLKKTYPKYYSLISENTKTSVKEIQEKLHKSQTLLEYFVGYKNIFIFLISKDNYIVKQVALDFPLKEWVQDLRKGIYGNWSNKKGNSEQFNVLYQNSAFALYDKLVAPIENNLTEEVIIIPDAELNFIPFDALLTDKGNPTSYLIKEHQISYNYSATHYLQLLNSEETATSKTVLAVAPSFNNNTINYESLLAKRSGLSNLEFNIPEAKAITTLFDGTLLESNNATKENFLKQAKDYNIIHLSTHAKSNDAMGEFSYIAFQNSADSTAVNNSRLYVNELYNLELNADLVVLSACETGLGELKRGEGVISLARGFTYAGAKSTLTSLWSVNDAQTTKLMESFYTNLKEGMPKDKALRQAKLDYLSNENLNAPYFWAGFIPAGDMSAIQTGANYWYWVFGIVILLLLLIVVVKRKTVS